MWQRRKKGYRMMGYQILAQGGMTHATHLPNQVHLCAISIFQLTLLIRNGEQDCFQPLSYLRALV
jgi:hypothetical protein